MTANQLRFWELRWKQHYESLYLAEMQRANIAKETETSRHNRAQERIATQELVLKRQELGLQWAKLEESIRAAMVKEIIDYENAKTNRYNAKLKQSELQIKAYEAETGRMKVANELSIAFTKTELAVAELWLQAVDAKTDKQLEAWKHSIDQAKDAFKISGEVNIDPDFIFGDNNIKIDASTDLGKLILNIANFGKDMQNQAEFNDVIKHIKTIAPKQIEIYGPQTGLNFNIDSVQELDQHKLGDRAIERGVQRTIEGPTTAESTPGVVSGFSSTKERSKSSSNSNKSIGSTKDVVETKTPQGTPVIYSGGAHYGPGFVNNQGGFY